MDFKGKSYDELTNAEKRIKVTVEYINTISKDFLDDNFTRREVRNILKNIIITLDDDYGSKFPIHSD